MSSIVGQKGQIVLDRQIRQALGVGAGWRAVQKLVGDHIEIRLLPPEHNDSLRGVLKGHVVASPAEDWDDALGRSVADDFEEKSAP